MSATQERQRVAADRKLIAATQNDPRLYVPGSLEVAADGHMTWTDKCRPRCRHQDGVCHMARSGLAVREDWEDA